MIRKLLFGILMLIIVLLCFLAIGPRPTSIDIDPKIDELQIDITELDAFVAKLESSHPVYPGHEMKIIWADSNKNETEYALIYLHGFSASHVEGDSIHEYIAQKYGMNLLLGRLAYHGLDTKKPFYRF